LDTRTKIVEPRSLPSGGSVMVIVGYFDPIYAAGVRAIRELAPAESLVLAAIADPPEPLLPLRARAELAAALDCIDYVTTDIDAAMALPEAKVSDIRSDDLRRRNELVQHVVRRHRSE
jgi:hypothetical protein